MLSEQFILALMHAPTYNTKLDMMHIVKVSFLLLLQCVHMLFYLDANASWYLLYTNTCASLGH